MRDEPRISRLHLHIPIRTPTLIAWAALVTKQSVSEFIISAAMERAKRVLKQK
jgi:uncharacterized protein (DUF1778 family)